jgi:uncharacterized Tic20 family protein
MEVSPLKEKETVLPEEDVAEVSRPPSQWEPRQRAAHLTNEEMTVSALAHASVVLSFLTGGLGGVAAALVIWLIYKDKSRYVAFQAAQALVFQLAVAATLIAGGLTMVVSFVTICLIPLGLVLLLALIALPFVALIYGLYAAYETYYGKDFTYAWVGDFVREQGVAQWGQATAPDKESEPEEQVEAES